jgi:hypothetical protein
MARWSTVRMLDLQLLDPFHETWCLREAFQIGALGQQHSTIPRW